MPLKKSTRSKTTATKKSPATGARSRKKSKTPTWSVGAGTMLVAAMCVTGAVIVIAARELTPAPRAAAADLNNESAIATESPKAAPLSTNDAAEAVTAKAPETDTLEAKGTVGRTAPVTIFGCLQRSDTTLRLTDTDGIDAPRSRSWKTAFLKKGSASIEVTDPGNRLHLASHVGQRLSVTGTLVDREMQVRSLRRISASCD
jgi:hypothetical protein